LERAGHSVDLVNDGEQALDALENNRYNLAIIDMQMPVMPGLEAVKIYRITARHEQRIPIIILTANATTEAKRECEEAGADAFLTKPIDASRLLDTVARLATPYVATRQENKKPAASIVTESTKLLNEDTLHRLSLLGGGESDFLGIVVRGFISEGEHLVSAMEAALSKGEYGTFKELAHALKGSSGNVGAEALFQTCRKISRINQNDQLVSAEKLLGDVKAGFGATRQALTQHLEALKTP
jgi:two-component system sensor histidine kinase RpfC